MSIINILMVGVPETFLSVITMLFIAKGKIYTEKNIIKYLFKCTASIGFILSFIYLFRNNANSIVLITFLNTVIYGVCMFLLWNFNIRQSLICGSLVMFIIVISEIITVAPTVSLIVENILQYEFMSAKLVWSLPTRIIQILIITIITTKNMTLQYTTLLNTEWRDISSSQKRTTALSIVLVFISIVFNTNYSEFYVKMKINNIDVKLFNSSMSLLLVQSIIYLMTTLLLLNRTSKYEDYKNILNRDTQEIIEILTSAKGGGVNEKMD